MTQPTENTTDTYRCHLCDADVPTYPVGPQFVCMIPHKNARGRRCEGSNALREVRP